VDVTEDLTVNDLSLLIHLVDSEQQKVQGTPQAARLTYIRFCLVEKAIAANGGVDG
jgi:hypothetical protein